MVAKKTKAIATAAIKKNRLTYYVARKAKNVAKAQLQNIGSIKDIKQHRELHFIQDKYSNKNFPIDNVRRRKDIKIAVVIHLYYSESWKLFNQSLSVLDKDEFDLFITLPVQNADFSDEIKNAFPRANIFIVPNRGRDVLPFMRVIPALDKLGYEYILKIHSKKSTHRVDGKEWLEDMVGKLLPADPNNLEALKKVLKDSQTGIVGPSGHFVSLKVNFDPNKAGIQHLLSKIFSAKDAKNAIAQSKDYGFFAGTMFWARVDALKPIIDLNLPISKFEAEQGQIDATLAHVLERTFNLVPELQHKQMYAISSKGVKAIHYNSGIVPDWSNVYIGPKGPNIA